MTLRLVRHRFAPARARGRWRADHSRCRWMAEPARRVPIKVLRVLPVVGERPRLALVGAPVEYRLRIAALARDRKGTEHDITTSVRIVRDGRQWVTRFGAFPLQALAVASEVLALFDCTSEQAERYATQGWIPGVPPCPWFLPQCMGGAAQGDPCDGCTDCAHLDWLRERLGQGRTVRWR